MAAGSLLTLEGTEVRVAYEGLKRAARERKSLIDKAEKGVVSALEKASAALSGGDLSAAAASLTEAAADLQGYQQRLADVSTAEADESRRTRARLEHLHKLATSNGSLLEWNAPRLDRLVVDYLYREGHHDTARAMSQDKELSDLVCTQVYAEARQIASALRQRQCGPALSWCKANRARLKKAKSVLEFNLRVQEYVELVKAGQKQSAIDYARTHLAPWADQCLEELQRALVVIIFANRMSVPARYQSLLSADRWDWLAHLFHQELYKLNGLPTYAPLLLHMQAGLSALKTPYSLQPDASCQDPLSISAFRELARDMPFAKHVRSQLLCSVTREMMDDSNPPVVLPNGYVYSSKAIDMIKAQNGGRIVCPQTGNSYGTDELRRAFVV